ncbi:MAG TPA: hypothetical protein VF623_07075, partial [Segetibacter sp.]
MGNFYRSVFLVFILFASQSLIAQVDPVQFSFKGERDDKGQAFISIKAKIASGAGLFSAIKKSADDVFVSSVVFDTVSHKFLKDSLQETGSLQFVTDSATGGVPVGFFKDSVEWKQLLNLPVQDSTTIKGMITWLARQDQAFPGGEAPFSIKVKAVPVAKRPAVVNTDESLW